MSAKIFLKHIAEDEQGATAIEYGLIVALIAIAIITAIQGLAAETANLWNGVESKAVEATSNARS
ncbi:Flp family type IVb pilin [Erythrobacter alti]|uniref:Flp family type IVb pilin n=1 Tax=Erythrobacter alti TaxID=1896145 RepID=UPI0030F485AC